MRDRHLRLYRAASLALAIIFAAVGLAFLFLPEQVIGFFNGFSPVLGLATAPALPGTFFPILAAAYMYLVTWLAGLMFMKPGAPPFPKLLVQAKLASSALSLYFFFGRAPHLICLANAAADGFIAALVLGLIALQKKHSGSWPI